MSEEKKEKRNVYVRRRKIKKCSSGVAGLKKLPRTQKISSRQRLTPCLLLRSPQTGMISAIKTTSLAMVVMHENIPVLRS